MTAGVAAFISFDSEDDVRLSRWDITTTVACIVARHTVIVLIKIILSFDVGPPRSMRLHV